jgi:hypothetical protein
MSSHQSSAVSVASVLAAMGVLIIGYRVGRTHAAWKGIRVGQRAVRVAHRQAWGYTILMIFGALTLMAGLFYAGFDLSH